MTQFRLLCGALALVSLSACAILPGQNAPSRGPAPSAPADPGAADSNSGGLLSGILGGRAEPGQIGQCYSKNAEDAAIAYPAGWSRRVSRAETEDELLGGGSETLSAENAYAQPVKGAVSYTYPQAALSPPIEGVCEIKFNLSRLGAPSNIVSACSSELFIDAATKAVSETKFTPVRVNGSAANAVNMTYNMKFCLAD